MRLRIAHSTTYRYEPPATGVIQILRMTPGSHDGQYVAEWQIDVSTDSRLDVHPDAFGNVTHVLTKGDMAFGEAPSSSGPSAVEAFGLKRGVCQDYAHIFSACARSGGVPARFVAGHFLRSDGMVNQQAGHAWAEAFVPDLGWVGFDPANCVCTTDAHARVAIGLDYLGAAPVRGTRYGGGMETLTVAVNVDQAGRPGQWQNQS